MPVGDVNSTERGSGARYNDGKDPMEQIPVRYWIQHWIDTHALDPIATPDELDILLALQKFQERDPETEVFKIWTASGCEQYIGEAMAVFQYGAQKYALYNWAKGMAWSIPIGCILRHMRAHLHNEDLDPESGLPHIGHVACNIMMLDWFQRFYPEGDDRPSAAAPISAGRDAAGSLGARLPEHFNALEPMEPRAIIGHRVNV